MEVVAGLVAAMAAMIFFGSYAVPLKFPSVQGAQVEPIIYQTYKSIACFATSWLVLMYVPLKFTWWGLVGASLWCTTGIVSIVAVRLAGIGVAQSLWSGISIFVSYIWGAYVFKEPIKHPAMSVMALLVMASGMAGIGMAASGTLIATHRPTTRGSSDPHSPRGKSRKLVPPKREDEDSVGLLMTDTEGKILPTRTIGNERGDSKYRRDNKLLQGVMCAVFVGISNGSFLIPFKYATKEIHGVEYLVSFGIGTLTTTTTLLSVYSLVQICWGKPAPSFHFKAVAGPGLLTGLLWSAGNVCRCSLESGLIAWDASTKQSDMLEAVQLPHGQQLKAHEEAGLQGPWASSWSSH